MKCWGRGTLRAAGTGQGHVSARCEPVASSVYLNETEKQRWLWRLVLLGGCCEPSFSYPRNELTDLNSISTLGIL